jgi:uroporphyrinogen-III synthase
MQILKHGYGVFKTKETAEKLAEFIVKYSVKEKFIHFCGNLSLNVLDKKLQFQNIKYQKVIVYETVLLYPKILNDYDAVAFFSPSGVKSFIKYNSLNFNKIFSIGETTTAEIKKYTDQDVFTGKNSDLNSLLEIIKSQKE